jgi:hypothetical protein
MAASGRKVTISVVVSGEAADGILSAWGDKAPVPEPFRQRVIDAIYRAVPSSVSRGTVEQDVRVSAIYLAAPQPTPPRPAPRSTGACYLSARDRTWLAVNGWRERSREHVEAWYWDAPQPSDRATLEVWSEHAAYLTLGEADTRVLTIGGIRGALRRRGLIKRVGGTS